MSVARTIAEVAAMHARDYDEAGGERACPSPALTQRHDNESVMMMPSPRLSQAAREPARITPKTSRPATSRLEASGEQWRMRGGDQLLEEDERDRDQERRVDVWVLKEALDALARIEEAIASRDRRHQGEDPDDCRADGGGEIAANHDPGATLRVDVAGEPDRQYRPVHGEREEERRLRRVDGVDHRDDVEEDEERESAGGRERDPAQIQSSGDQCDQDQHREQQVDWRWFELDDPEAHERETDGEVVARQDQEQYREHPDPGGKYEGG